MNTATLWIIIGIILIILELSTPTMFFLSLGIAGIITSIFAYLGYTIITQTMIFLFSSIVLLAFVKPILATFYTKNSEIEDKYIGKTAKVILKTDRTDGRITIYGEDWQAKALNENDVFEVGEEIRIVKNESLIMYVEKI